MRSPLETVLVLHAPVLLAWCLVLPHASAQERKATFGQIVLGSSGGFTGRGSGKRISVDAKGKFDNLAGGKVRKGELKKEEQEKLQKLVAGVLWKEVKESYRGRGADFFQDDLAVTIAGKKHETHVAENVERKTLPRGLGELLAYLHELQTRYKP